MAVADGLVNHALATSSTKTYNRALASYKSFLAKHTTDLTQTYPSPPRAILAFIAHCYINKLAASTTLTYLSAIGYAHKLLNFSDPTQHFLVKKCLLGYNNQCRSPDKRLPITSQLLERLVHSLQFTCNAASHRCLLQAMFLLAFRAFLRVGELIGHGRGPAVVTYSCITFHYTADITSALELHPENYKHSHGKTVKLLIPAKVSPVTTCPVAALWQFCKLRGSNPGPLFTFPDGSQVSRTFFSSNLRASLIFCGCDTTLYKGHSFRIGAATSAAEQGISESQIQEMGRWKSSAFKKYIRIPMLQN
ncbi:uncharacterized protein LOC128235807 [Mya arenaria]|uniref:uncharacterized protein LOC128235807 n=1 Tax=Mya arenaria TaxID=6604 RepID=UPI0022E5A1CF|nr:uncharacterized protein LOC128235807 [Mya arenaria]